MANRIPYSIKTKIDRYEPVTVENITLYPITVNDYDAFQFAAESLEFPMQSLPVTLLSKPAIQAFYDLDRNTQSEEENKKLFIKSILLFALALRLAPGKEVGEILKNFGVSFSDDQKANIKNLVFRNEEGDMFFITPVQFSRFREIIAAQNGVEIPSENANPELLEAEKDIAEAKAGELEGNLSTMVTALAIFCHEKEEEIYEWPMLKFKNRLKECHQLLDYVICGVSEMQGTKWKGGNPVPHPWFTKQKNGSSALISMNDFASGNGAKAIQNPGTQN